MLSAGPVPKPSSQQEYNPAGYFMQGAKGQFHKSLTVNRLEDFGEGQTPSLTSLLGEGQAPSLRGGTGPKPSLRPAREPLRGWTPDGASPRRRSRAMRRPSGRTRAHRRFSGRALHGFGAAVQRRAQARLCIEPDERLDGAARRPPPIHTYEPPTDSDRRV